MLIMLLLFNIIYLIYVYFEKDTPVALEADVKNKTEADINPTVFIILTIFSIMSIVASYYSLYMKNKYDPKLNPKNM